MQWPAIATDENRRRRAVAGDESASHVDHAKDLHARQHILHERFSELAFHKAVRREHADKPAVNGELKAPLKKGNRQRNLAPHACIELPINLAQRGVFTGCERRLGEHHRIALAHHRRGLLALRPCARKQGITDNDVAGQERRASQ
ncbi:MAG TPA: hypothetical protein VK459_27285, partial [Polyangiaceae bacterium]|nr:hypothetical protein [Polyangiaceae bacterium]